MSRTNPPLTRRRWLAGAASLAAPAFIPHARAADLPRFELGIASGQPRADGMVLWTRLTGPDLPERVAVQWELANDEAFSQVVAQGNEEAEAAWAHSVHAEPAGLAPGRWYFYRFRALGQQSAVGRTRTAPAPDAAATLNFVIASCQRWDHGHWAAWRHAVTQPLDVVLFLGDYIYEYPSPPNALRAHQGGLCTALPDYRARYAQYKSDPALQAAHAAFPWLLVWDDHEVANDYAGLAGGLPLGDFEAQRAAAYQAYWEHMPFAKAQRPRGAHMRIVGRLDWGRLARIHLLDDRQYRDPQACQPAVGRSSVESLKRCAALTDPKRTLLGAEQEQWLEQGWDRERPWNLLAQQTLMARFTSTDAASDTGPSVWTDGWDGYGPARARLLAGAQARGAKGLVVLGGDVHAHHVADLHADPDKPGSPKVGTEFCGTSISSRGRAQASLDAARPFNPHMRYARADQRGLVAFTLDDKLLKAELMAVRQPLQADSAVDVAARFTVEAARPGAQAG